MPKTTINKKDVNKIEVIKDLAVDFFAKMGTDGAVEVTEDMDNDAYLVNIESEKESGLIIGNRGRTLNSIQYLLGMMFRNKTDEWKRILVDVSDWREKEEEKLNELAVNTAARAKETGEPQQLYNLTPSQRRIIHMALSKEKGITTESIGEGKDRYLVVNPK